MRKVKIGIQVERIGWKLLAWSGFWFIPSGVLLVLTAWKPTSGPYIIGENYPYGTVTEAWQVSLAFILIAFGILFVCSALIGEKLESRWIWYSLVVSAVLMLFPHVFLGVMLIFDDPTFASFGTWIIALPFSFLWALTMLAGFSLSWKTIKLGNFDQYRR
jgi:hypothetical protein